MAICNRARSNGLRVESGEERSFAAFSLVEMLVVIAIIGILAGLLLPVLSNVKTRAKVKIAKTEMANLVAAISAYEAEYSRMPASDKAIASAVANPTCKDFTYGGTIGGTVVKSGGTPSYQTDNSEPMALVQTKKVVTNTTLVALSQRFNPRQHDFFKPKYVESTSLPGLGPDGVLRDPWGTPYVISLDLDDDNVVVDGFYSDVLKRVGQDGGIRASAVVWSAGPDLTIDATKKPKEGVNYDNILSWE